MAVYKYTCGHTTVDKPPRGDSYGHKCSSCRAAQIEEGKRRAGWIPGKRVYTVVGEGGNSEVAYTHELPTMAAALDAIAREELPLAPVTDDGGLVYSGSRVSFSVARAHCYAIIEHEPRLRAADGSHEVYGGMHSPPARRFWLDAGEMRGDSSLPVPPAWTEYAAQLQAFRDARPRRTNYSGVYREVLQPAD